MTVLAEYWTETPDGWINARAREEIEKAGAQALTNQRIADEREARRVPADPSNGIGLTEKKRQPKGKEPAASSPVWDAYKDAFHARYGVEPPRNAKVNAGLCQVVARLGIDDAVAVAGWYPTHNGRWYVEKGHSVAIMVADAEKLRTEWATGKTVTSTKAAQLDRGQSNFDAAAEAERIREARE